MSLSVYLNGEEKTFDLPSSANIRQLLEIIQVKEDRVALEVNGDIVRRSLWTETKLSAGDRIELVHFVGGGSLPPGTSL